MAPPRVLPPLLLSFLAVLLLLRALVAQTTPQEIIVSVPGIRKLGSWVLYRTRFFIRLLG